MINLNAYITEKLKLNKDIIIAEFDLATIIYNLFYVHEIYDDNRRQIDNNINEWAKDYNITDINDVQFYVQKSVKNQFNDDKNHITYLDDADHINMLHDLKLISDDLNKNKKYNKSFNGNGHLEMSGNKLGFVISGWNGKSSNYTLTIKIIKK